MTETTKTTALDTSTTPVTVVPAAVARGLTGRDKPTANPVSRKTLSKKAAPKPTAHKPMPKPAKAPIVRAIAAGQRLADDAIVICNIDIRTVKVAGNKNWHRAH